MDRIEQVAGIVFLGNEALVIAIVQVNRFERGMRMRKRNAELSVGAARQAIKAVHRLQPSFPSSRFAPEAGDAVGMPAQPFEERLPRMPDAEILRIEVDRGSDGIDHAAGVPSPALPRQGAEPSVELRYVELGGPDRLARAGTEQLKRISNRKDVVERLGIIPQRLVRYACMLVREKAGLRVLEILETLDGLRPVYAWRQVAEAGGNFDRVAQMPIAGLLVPSASSDS